MINDFRSLVYAKNEEDFLSKLESFDQHHTVMKYPQFQNHIKNMYLGREGKWARYKQLQLPTHGNDTTNYIESSFRILKDKVFNKTKAYNLVDLLNVFMREDSGFFKDK